MRAFVLLYLLHTVFGHHEDDNHSYSWGDSPDHGSYGCASKHESCGCCLMKRQLQRMETFFDLSRGTLKKELEMTKKACNDMKASRSVFSVALNTNSSKECRGPFNGNVPIVYKHVFINLGDNYNTDTGVFTAPRSGIYVLAVTIYGDSKSANQTTCAKLQVNGKVMSELEEDPHNDPEDSGTVYATVQLMAGDKVTVSLPRGCVVCDDNSHFNTFTGFLLYATETNM